MIHCMVQKESVSYASFPYCCPKIYSNIASLLFNFFLQFQSLQKLGANGLSIVSTDTEVSTCVSGQGRGVLEKNLVRLETGLYVARTYILFCTMKSLLLIN